MAFDIREHLDQLTPDGGHDHARGDHSYKCPLCGAPNFKVNVVTGKWSSFGCDCASTEVGKGHIREELSPAEKQRMAGSIEAPLSKAPRPRQKRSWDYYTAATLKCGNPVLTVHREDDPDAKKPKQIWQEAKVPGKSLAEIARNLLPYGSHEALTAPEDDPIFYVEGEPCVDALRAIGLVGVTSIGGAGKFRPDRDGGLFLAERLVVCPDRDVVGLKHAEDIAAAYPGCRWLYAFPDSPEWEAPAPGGGLDVADWIEAGVTKVELLAAIQKDPRHPFQRRLEVGQRLPENNFAGDDLEEVSDVTPTGKLRALKQTAIELLRSGTPYDERLPIMRAAAKKLDIRILDSELHGMLTAARRGANGGTGPVLPGEALEGSPIPWAWEGLIIQGCLNLLVAMPKAGKSSLMLAWIAAWHRENPTFLGRELYGPCPPVLLAGTDQGERDWSRMLSEAGLARCVAGGDQVTIQDPLIGLYHAGRPLHLDPEGIDAIAKHAQEHPGLLILIDSLSACIAPLGLREESPQVAEPILELMEQIGPHGATVVLIHHSGKGRAGEGAVSASRGSTALPATASQTLELSRTNTNPVDHRMVLSTEGRVGPRQRFIVERCGATWLLRGNADELELEQEQCRQIQKLNNRQADALDLVQGRWSEGREWTTASDVAAELGLKSASSARDAWRLLNQLQKRNLVVGETTSGGFQRGSVNRYRPIHSIPESPRFNSPKNEESLESLCSAEGSDLAGSPGPRPGHPSQSTLYIQRPLAAEGPKDSFSHLSTEASSDSTDSTDSTENGQLAGDGDRVESLKAGPVGVSLPLVAAAFTFELGDPVDYLAGTGDWEPGWQVSLSQATTAGVKLRIERQAKGDWRFVSPDRLRPSVGLPS